MSDDPIQAIVDDLIARSLRVGARVPHPFHRSICDSLTACCDDSTGNDECCVFMGLRGRHVWDVRLDYDTTARDYAPPIHYRTFGGRR